MFNGEEQLRARKITRKRREIFDAPPDNTYIDICRYHMHGIFARIDTDGEKITPLRIIFSIHGDISELRDRRFYMRKIYTKNTREWRTNLTPREVQYISEGSLASAVKKADAYRSPMTFAFRKVGKQLWRNRRWFGARCYEICFSLYTSF